MRNWTKCIAYFCFDLSQRAFNKIVRLALRRTVISNISTKSDSQVSFYSETVDLIVSNHEKFGRFRRIYNYREILEHVSYRQGQLYLEKTLYGHKDFEINSFFPHRNDSVGSPRVFTYLDGKKCSPTTIRYLAVALEIKSIFPLTQINHVAEIGAGYGGQCSILQDIFQIQRYTIFDLPNVQNLITQYLEALNRFTIVEFGNTEDRIQTEIDFVLSNYAFSELPMGIQQVYIENVLAKSKSGYMIMNSGLTNFTKRSEGKILLSQLRSQLPNSFVIGESPLSSEDNYVLVWGENLNLSNVEILPV